MNLKLVVISIIVLIFSACQTETESNKYSINLVLEGVEDSTLVKLTKRVNKNNRSPIPTAALVSLIDGMHDEGEHLAERFDNSSLSARTAAAVNYARFECPKVNAHL